MLFRSHSQILGKWSVDAEALGLDKKKRALQVTWEFLKDGTLKTVGEDRSGRIGDKMDIDIKYSVEDGLIRKQITPGREKYEDCSVLELSDKAMTLKCKFLYLFLSRK